MTASGLHAEQLPREERAAAADAGLHLVEDQQGAVLVGERACFRQLVARQRMDAALALHGLEQDRRRLVGDLLGERRRRREADPGNERLEGRAFRGLTGHRERAERAAVEGPFEGDELRAGRSTCAPT